MFYRLYHIAHIKTTKKLSFLISHLKYILTSDNTICIVVFVDAIEKRLQDLETRVSALESAKTTRFKPPTEAEALEYALSIGFDSFDPEEFINHYEANGWIRGKTKMKSWKAAIRLWKTNAKSKPKPKKLDHFKTTKERLKGGPFEGLFNE